MGGSPGLPCFPGASGPYESLKTDQDIFCLIVQSPDTFLLVQQQGFSIGRTDPGLDLVILFSREVLVSLLQEGAGPV